MVHIIALLIASTALGISSALPHQKRIAQVIADATADWEQACVCIILGLCQSLQPSHNQKTISSPQGVLRNATLSLKLPSPVCWLQGATVTSKTQAIR